MIFPKNVSDLPIEIRRNFEFISGPFTESKTGITVVIPVRGVDRQSNLNYCISRLLLQSIFPLEILVSEEDSVERVNISLFIKDSRVRKIFTHSSKPFNKSIAVNVGVCRAAYSKIVMNDADIIPPKGYLARVDQILDEYDSCFLPKEIYNVNLLRSGVTWCGSKRNDYFSGGSIAFTKKTFIDIGGMCEKFYGYGSEDCEFWSRIRNTKMLEARDTTVLHIAHRRPNAYSTNVEIYEEIINQPMEKRISNLKEDLSKRLVIV